MPEPSVPPFLRPAFVTALAAALISLGVAAVLVIVARGQSGSVIDAVRSSVRVWIVSLGSGIDIGGSAVRLVPLGATLVCVAVVARVAAWVATEPIVELGAFATATAGTYGLLAGVASIGSDSGTVHTSVVRAVLGAVVVGGLGSALGAALAHRRLGDMWFTTNPHVRAIGKAAVPAILAVIAAAGAVVIVLLVRHLPRAADLWALLDPGLGGGIALAAVCLLAVPTLVLWTVSALIGPGFVLGSQTSVDLTGAHLGAVPGLPVLAALPPPGAFPAWMFLLGLVPLAAGMLAGWRVDTGKRVDVLARVGSGAASGGVAGFLLGVMVALSGGAIGPGRMSEAGPPIVTPLLVAVPVMAMGGALGAALAHYRGSRAKQPSDASKAGRARFWKRHQSPGSD